MSFYRFTACENDAIRRNTRSQPDYVSISAIDVHSEKARERSMYEKCLPPGKNSHPMKSTANKCCNNFAQNKFKPIDNCNHTTTISITLIGTLGCPSVRVSITGMAMCGCHATDHTLKSSSV